MPVQARSVTEATVVRLDGTWSADPDGGLASYQWTQTLGPAVALSDPASPQPTFVAPPVGPDGTELILVLTVAASR